MPTRAAQVYDANNQLLGILLAFTHTDFHMNEPCVQIFVPGMGKVTLINKITGDLSGTSDTMSYETNDCTGDFYSGRTELIDVIYSDTDNNGFIKRYLTVRPLSKSNVIIKVLPANEYLGVAK